MIGQYVRMQVPPYTRGTIKGARFQGGVVRFLFQQDTRFDRKFLDVWLLDSELEECVRPTDEQIARMNKLA